MNFEYFEYEVSSLGPRNTLKFGTLMVSSFGLKYRSKTEKVSWAWQHIRKYACDGNTFLFIVGPGHELGEGYNNFSGKKVADLFLRVRNYTKSHTNNYQQQSGANIHSTSPIQCTIKQY